jgi:hypothetical protein
MWGSLCAMSFAYAYFFVPETKGLSLEQVDMMLEETTPRTSSRWTPHSMFVGDIDVATNVEFATAEKAHSDESV